MTSKKTKLLVQDDSNTLESVNNVLERKYNQENEYDKKPKYNVENVKVIWGDEKLLNIMQLSSDEKSHISEEGKTDIGNYKVIPICNEETFQNYVFSGSIPKLIVCEFSANWCPPSQAFVPTYESLARQYGEHAVFFKVCQEEQEHDDNWYKNYQKMKFIPEFQFYKNGQLLDQFAGTSKNILTGYIRKHLFNEPYVETKIRQSQVDIVVCEASNCRRPAMISIACHGCRKRFCKPHLVKYSGACCQCFDGVYCQNCLNEVQCKCRYVSCIVVVMLVLLVVGLKICNDYLL
eukprot:523978_1